MIARRTQGWLLAGILLGAIIGVLAAANVGAAHGGCAWVFPKAVGCILATREGLAGGLIGAAGVIFAGWLAWIAAQHQFALARNADLRINIGQLADEGETFARFVETARQLSSQIRRWDSDRTLGQDIKRPYLGIVKRTASEADALYDKLDRVQMASVGDDAHRRVLQDFTRKAADLIETAQAIDSSIIEVQGSYQHSQDFDRRTALKMQFDTLLDAALKASESRSRVIDGIRQQMS